MGQHASFGWKQDGWTRRVVDGVAKQVPRMIPDEQEREEVRLIVQWHDIEGLSFAAITDRLEAMYAASADARAVTFSLTRGDDFGKPSVCVNRNYAKAKTVFTALAPSGQQIPRFSSRKRN